MDHEKKIILMYHGVVQNASSSPKQREAGAELYDVSVEQFHQQLQWLSHHGYNADNLIITFDDGEMNNYTLALGLLEKFHFKAYFFIIGNRVGTPGYMGWRELQKIHASGMTIGSHGLSHEILTNLLDTQIEEELLASKKYLERNLNISVTSLSIPRGFCNEKIIRMARQCGYREIFVSEKPSDIQSPCYARVAVKNSWTIKRFEQAMAGRLPLREKLMAMVKSPAKAILKENGYNTVRRLLIKAAS